MWTPAELIRRSWNHSTSKYVVVQSGVNSDARLVEAGVHPPEFRTVSPSPPASCHPPSVLLTRPKQASAAAFERHPAGYLGDAICTVAGPISSRRCSRHPPCAGCRWSPCRANRNITPVHECIAGAVGDALISACGSPLCDRQSHRSRSPDHCLVS